MAAPRRLALAMAASMALCSVLIQAQIPGRNINMVTGTKFPGGDPWLQKQNEPSGAVSTVNPCRLVGGANDYRAVNVRGLPADRETGDSWVGLYTSIDCGQTWYSTLVPGYPQDTTAIGKASPVYGLTTAADPTIRAGAGGFFAYSFIAFNRGSNVGKLAVARLLDRNTTEAVTKPETAISYVDTRVVDVGSAGQFLDKPTTFVTQGAGTCTLNGQTIPASTVHFAWTVFVGNSDQVIRTKVYYARSSNCGATLDGPPTKLSEGYAVTQSASIAVAPNGKTYVVWRQFSTTKGDPDQLLVAHSVDGGKTFTKGSPIPFGGTFTPFDQGTSSKTFRTNAFPTTAVDQYNRLYVALAVRGFASDVTQARVVVMSTTDGVIWNMPQAIENSAVDSPGHQIMPAMTAVGGKLNVVWLDFRDDASRKFEPFIKEIFPIRHTMDVRGAQAVPQSNGALNWTSYGILQHESPVATAPRISRYLTGDFPGEPVNTLKQLQFNRPNLKLYAGGTRPFIGDYIDVAGLDYIAQGTPQTWIPNNGSIPLTAAQTFYAFWTDNRDAKVGRAPQEPDSEIIEGADLGYVAPGTSACAAFGANPPTKTRNANVYMARITPGVFVAAPTNSKPSINASGRLQRAFPVLVENRTNQLRKFALTIANQPPDAPTTGIATFLQVPSPFPSPLPAPVLAAEVFIPPNSSITRPVYVVSGVKYPRIRVNVIEAGTVPGSTPLTGSTILNLNTENADIENADIENADIENTDIQNKELHNADIENADIENADIENADIENADIENADIENADIENADIENADIENADIENADIENADIENADIENGSLTDFSVDLENKGNTATGYQVKAAMVGDTSPYLYQLIGRRVYKTPTAVGCELKEAGQNQILFNITLTAADLVPGALPDPLDPSPTNATVLVKPGEHIKVTLRVWDKDVLTGPTAPPNDGIQPFCPLLSPSCPAVTSSVTITARSLSSNTGSNTPVEVSETVSSDVPFTFAVTNKNDSGPGSFRQALTNANNHIGFTDVISFAIPGAGPHTIIPVSPLPAATEPIVIDGTSQPGYAGSPLIEINGAKIGVPSPGLVLGGGSSTVRGLAINGFNGNGIALLSNGNVVAGNYIGTDLTGTIDRGNLGSGIHILDAGNNTVGGDSPGMRNVISGNTGEGVRLDGALATGNLIRGNYIGTNASGVADLGNSNSGVFIRKAPGNSVIGNLISGNDGFAGVAICGSVAPFPCGGGDVGSQSSNASGNIVQGNVIGLNADGSGPLKNNGYGVSLDGAPNNVVGGAATGDGNSIAHNSIGVVVFNPGATGNQLRRNSIHSNVGLGIDLAASLPSPVLTSAAQQWVFGGCENVPPGQPCDMAANLQNTVEGFLSGPPNTEFVIDFFNSPVCDPSGNGEGQTWLRSLTQSTDGEGQLVFSIPLGPELMDGTLVTATATSATAGTSEFSGCEMVVPPGFEYSAPRAGGNGHVYEYVPTPGSWTVARDAAAARTFRGVAGHLVTITSAFENDIVSAFRSGGDLRGWIGLTDEAKEGTFVWVTGEPVTYTNWWSGPDDVEDPEPNNQNGNEHYAEIYAAGVWNDQTLNSNGLNQGYVVEYDTDAFFTGAADLVVHALTHSPAAPTTADNITFTAMVKNIGGATARASTLLFDIGGETPGLPQTLYAVPSLNPGEIFIVERQMVLGTARNYRNTATADYRGAVGESNELNNTTLDDYTVSPVGGRLTFKSSDTTIGSWTQGVAQSFELTVDMDTKTTSLSINGSPVNNAQNVAFTATALSRVGVEFGTTGTQRFGWDDVLVRDAEATTTIFSGDFTVDAVDQPPGTPAVGEWTITNQNGSVLVRASSGNLLAKPVELQQSGGTNSVNLLGALSTAPTTGVWIIQWKSVMASPGTGYPGFIFVPVVVRGSGGEIIATVEYR
jgi:hypothetical protein